MRVESMSVAPSQDFLKERTVRFILECIREGKEDELPPAPIVREDESGQLVAIDGHNLLAVNAFLGRQTDVHLAKNPEDGLPETSEANVTRNQDLHEKFETCLEERNRVREQGIATFRELIAKYPELFGEQK